MASTITVEQALRKATRHTLIAIGILFLCVTSGIAFFLHLNILPLLGVIAGLLIGGPLAYTYYIYGKLRWYIWAADNVTDIHELKKNTTLDLATLTRLHLISPSNKKALLDIDIRLLLPYKFIDDHGVPAESLVFDTSWKKGYSFLFVSLPVAVIGIIAMLCGLLHPLPIMMSVFGGAGLIGAKMLLSGKPVKPQIIINAQGISSQEGFDSWSHISDEKTETRSQGKNNTILFLMYKLNGEWKDVSLEDVDIDEIQILHILYVHRRRYEAAKTPATD